MPMGTQKMDRRGKLDKDRQGKRDERENPDPARLTPHSSIIAEEGSSSRTTKRLGAGGGSQIITARWVSAASVGLNCFRDSGLRFAVLDARLGTCAVTAPQEPTVEALTIAYRFLVR